MSRRLIALRQLAWSLDDLRPAVKASRTGAGSRGEAATRRQECPTCRGDRQVRDKFQRLVSCVTCEGKGWVKVDPYTQRSDAVGWASGPPTRRVLCDACGGSGRRGAHGEGCGRCGGSGGFSVPLVAEDDVLRGDPAVRLESQLERRARAGSYVELERALGRLLASDQWAWREFIRTRVLVDARHEDSEGAWDREPATSGERTLLGWMPRPIRVPADVRHAWEHRHVHRRQAEQAREKARYGSKGRRDRRDRQIRELYDRGRGLSSDVLADRFGISTSQVRRIVSR